MHALRGASVSGLCGMRPRAGMLIRPLLDVEPEELREYLGAHGIGFREDATNADTRYTRNFVRHVILPDCERAYPGSRAGLCRLARAAQRDDDFMSGMADAEARLCLFDYPGGFYLDAERMRGLHDAIGARIAARAMRLCGQDAQEAGVECILAALHGTGAGGNLPGDVRVSRGAHRVYLELPDPGRGSHRAGALDECAAVNAHELPARVECSLGALEIKALKLCPGADLGDGIWEQAMDAAALCGAELRFRRAGDAIWPLGAPGEKKLKDFYIDKKVDRQIRGYLPVLARGDRVLWALGVGASRDCKVGADTRSAVRLSWQGRRFWQ
jgi:tRNA(Ile)-lysidine synthase